jgi:hypothetical protein
MAAKDQRKIEDKIKALPPELRKEAEEFVDSLVKRRQRKPQGMKLEWRGALRDLKDRYTSVELQHAISAWRVEDE